jgi:toxin-antitoxin system PIN domain toxin
MNGRVVLLDVNALLSLLWPASEFHFQVRAWFRDHASDGWATCPMTQCGFVRLASNPALTTDAPTIAEAVDLLQSNLAHPKHVFWPDDLSVMQAIAQSDARLQGHKQITDAYLLGLAIRRKGRLATLDQSLSSLLPRGREKEGWVIDIDRSPQRH